MPEATPFNRIPARLTRSALVTVLVGVLAIAGGASPVHAEDAGMNLDVRLDLREDGLLGVTATITATQAAEGEMDLDVPVEGNRIQHFAVSDISTTAGAAAEVDHGKLKISAPADTTSTVSYTARGAVTDGPELQQVTWLIAAGWSTPIGTLTGTFTSPTATPDSPICGYGQLDERRLCTLTQTEVGGAVTFQHNNLKAHGVAVFSVMLPAGTVTPTATFTPISATTANEPASRAAAVTLAAAVLVALALGGFAWLRRRADDASAHAAGSTADLLVSRGGQQVFASPDGVLPGQIGTLTTGRVRPADIGATVLDLAVRNYLWIAELPRSSGLLDFQISRRATLDDDVTGFERAVVDAVLPEQRESVTASQLAQRVVDLETTRPAIAASLVAGGWLRRGPRRLELAGYAVLGVAAVVAAGLAAAGAEPLWAVAAAVLGGGLAAAGRFLPVRTVSGSRLAAAVNGMREQLGSLDPAEVAATARPVLFQRALPYAHALGELPVLLRTWAPDQPVEWYQPAGDRPALAGLPMLAGMLDGVAARSEAIEQR